MNLSGLHVLVVDDEANIRRTLKLCLEADGHLVETASNIESAVAVAERQALNLAFVDMRLGTASGLDLIPQLLAKSPWIKIVVITAFGSIETAVEAMKRGAADFLTKPFTPVEVSAVVDRLTRLRGVPSGDSSDPDAGNTSEPAAVLESGNLQMQQAVAMGRQVAPTHATVLIRGESGTGKGVLASAIHSWSDRAGKAMAMVACPSLSPELLESELFGHARGAFTGAVREHEGRIAAADGGTLFLDEIGDLPLTIQPKLLRFLQDRRYERVGDTATRRADVRVIAATNIDLEAAVKSGRFREDLFYRLNVVQIHLPPLRERPNDVVMLAERLLGFFARSSRVIGFTPEALTALRTHQWPGNIRELRNVIERAVILCQGQYVGVEHLPSPGATPMPKVGDAVSVDQLEEAHIREVLKHAKSFEEAAKTLGMDAATLWRKRRRYQI